MIENRHQIAAQAKATAAVAIPLGQDSERLQSSEDACCGSEAADQRLRESIVFGSG